MSAITDRITPSVDRDLFHKYAGISLPRHVAYPMPTWWEDNFDEDEARAMRIESGDRPDAPGLSLYLHVPFCEALCKFCACNRVIIRKDRDKWLENTNIYVKAMRLELRRLAEQIGDRPMRQIHWGGGTPTYLNVQQIEDLCRTTDELFDIAEDAEISIEVDPRATTDEQLQILRKWGFNRISMGVQDFNEQVQKHVRRIQPYEMIEQMTARCRELGFASVNFDLIYGLPYQTVESVHDTVVKTVGLAPDRIAFYHYAQIPQKIATQRGIDHTKLPDSDTKLDMFLDAIATFGASGYEFIGLDHFAKTDEFLAKALREGTIQRNFQGMTTGGGLDLIGVGATSISHLEDVGFLQNMHTSNDYVEAITRGVDPVVRGKRLTFDDRVRQATLSQLYCLGEIRPELIEPEFDIAFTDYFRDELATLVELEQDGLVTLDSVGGVQASFPLGRVLLRNVAAVFDAYLSEDAHRKGELRVFSANA